MDAVPYGTADEACPPVPLPPAADAGLSSCLLEGRLASHGRDVEHSVFDVDALRAVEYALLHRGSVLICPADPLSPLAALIAAAVHVDAMVRAKLATGRAERSPLRVCVVSTDYRLRGFYRGLAVRERRGVGGVPMRSIVPAATVRDDGGPSVIDREDGCWSTAFVRSVDAARKLDGLDLLIVDLPAPEITKLRATGVPTVVVTRDPYDPATLTAAAEMTTFGYDWAVHSGLGLDGAASDGAGSLRLANRAGRQVRLVPVVAPSVCTDAGLFWADLGPLLRVAGRSAFVRRLVTDACGLFHDLVGLAMPVAEYERMLGRSLDGRVDALARSARIVADRELREDWLPMVEEELAGLLNALRAADRGSSGDGARYRTKAEVLPPVVGEALDERKDVLVVTRTAALARVYGEYLRPRWPTLRVASLGEIAVVRPADVAVLLGMAPRWGRWVYRCGIGRELVVLAYTARSGSGRPAPITPGSGPDNGFDEAGVVAAAVGLQTEVGLGMSAPPQRVRAWEAVRSGRSEAGAYRRGADGGAVGVVTADVPPPPEVPPGLWDGGGWTAGLDPDPASDDGASGTDAAEVAPGMRVVFTDGTWAWLHDDSLVWRWRRNLGRTDPVEARKLSVGDAVMFIDGDAQKTLLTKVLEVASEVPELAVASTWVEYWRTALARANARFGSYAAVHRALAAHGCDVDYQTVRLWCVGATIGPSDADNVRRLGDVLDDSILRDSHGLVRQGIRTLRGAHIRLGRRLAGLARSLGPAAGGGHLPADEVIDDASGLTAADVESAVEVVTVAEVEPAAVVPRVLTGHRRGPDEPVDLIRTIPDEEQK